MQHQFKAGDLALIVVSVSPGSPNLGRCVELERLIYADQEFTRPDGSLAIVRLPHGVSSAWVVIGDGLSVHRARSKEWVETGYSLQISEHLMPLKGDQSPTQTNTETPKEVVHG